MIQTCNPVILHVVPGEEQLDIGVDAEASGAEMQDSNWTNCRPALSTVTVSVSRLGGILIKTVT